MVGSDPSKEVEFLREEIETLKADRDNDKRNAGRFSPILVAAIC